MCFLYVVIAVAFFCLFSLFPVWLSVGSVTYLIALSVTSSWPISWPLPAIVSIGQAGLRTSKDVLSLRVSSAGQVGPSRRRRLIHSVLTEFSMVSRTRKRKGAPRLPIAVTSRVPSDGVCCCHIARPCLFIRYLIACLSKLGVDMLAAGWYAVGQACLR